MDSKECMFCKHCDVNRINDIHQVRCRRFSTYVNLFDSCDYFITDGMIEIERIVEEIIVEDRLKRGLKNETEKD